MVPDPWYANSFAQSHDHRRPDRAGKRWFNVYKEVRMVVRAVVRARVRIERGWCARIPRGGGTEPAFWCGRGPYTREAAPCGTPWGRISSVVGTERCSIKSAPSVVLERPSCGSCESRLRRVGGRAGRCAARRRAGGTVACAPHRGTRLCLREKGRLRWSVHSGNCVCRTTRRPRMTLDPPTTDRQREDGMARALAAERG